MNKRQIEWAMRHDWYHNANGDVVYVIELMTGEILAFNDYAKLRAWAGY